MSCAPGTVSESAAATPIMTTPSISSHLRKRESRAMAGRPTVMPSPDNAGSSRRRLTTATASTIPRSSDLEKEQAAVARADEGGEAAHLDPGVPETGHDDRQHRHEGDGGEPSHGQDGIGARVGASLRRGGAEEQREREERAEPDAHRDEMQRIREHGDRSQRLHRNGMAGPRARGERGGGQRPRLDAPRHPVDGRVFALTEQEQRGEQDEQAVTEQPHRAELAVHEQSPPERRIEQRAGRLRHHGHLIPERRDPEPSAAAASQRAMESVRAAHVSAVRR